MKSYRRRSNLSHRRANDTPGHDAFLDIVANLVGILIILVVVVGAHAGASISAGQDADESPAELAQQIQETIGELERERARTVGLRQEHARINGRMRDERQLFLALRQQRSELLIEQARLDREFEERTSQLQSAEQERADWVRQRMNLEIQLETIERELAALDAAESAQQKQIVHYPTPLAKTVFSDEVHCRVMGGRIVWVPIDELVGQMRSEWKVKAEKLKSSQKTVETVGPIDHFRLQYTLETVEQEVLTELGRYTEKAVEFKRFVVLPTSDALGWKVSEAIQPDSQFMKTLAFMDPQRTTVSIWVYSDSYSEFNEVKNLLQSKGFRTAVWPLSMGKLISGGPNGYRSSAQ